MKRKPEFVSSCGISSDHTLSYCASEESISDGVFTVDFEERITFFNRAAMFITGFKAEGAIGYPMFRFHKIRAGYLMGCIGGSALWI